MKIFTRTQFFRKRSAKSASTQYSKNTVGLHLCASGAKEESNKLPSIQNIRTKGTIHVFNSLFIVEFLHTANNRPIDQYCEKKIVRDMSFLCKL